MLEADRQRFCELSTAFYRAHADQFDASRQGPWESWQRLLDIMKERSSIQSLLDVGCGNGRFATFLDDNGFAQTKYTGIDSEARFIELAQARHPNKSFSTTSIEDVLKTDETYDVIVSFGVFHHLPGEDFRVSVLKTMSERLNLNGVMAISFWQPRLLSNIDSKQYEGPESNGLERNDFLFGWGGDFTHLRYCHHFENDEIEALIAQSNLDLVALFQGSGNDLSNRYAVLRKLI